MTPPNILYLHSHDTGRYIQPYGYPVDTPNLQRLAGEGVTFRNAFSAAPTCSPSRAALLTGQNPHAAGMLGLAHRGFALNAPSRHLAGVLAAAGYHTVLAGMQHVAHGTDAISACGYQEIHADPDRAETIAAEFLRGNPRQPFFLDAGFTETHRVGTSFGESPDEEEWIERQARWARPPAPLPDIPEVRRDMAAFLASVRRLDLKIGVILDALDESGLAENTLVIYTPDHGLAFPRIKCTLTDQGIGVALIARGPVGFKGGRVIDALVSQLDVYPTLCELAGIDLPEWLEGRSLVPLISGDIESVRDEIFAEVTFHAAYEPMRAVRTARWKYIRRFSSRRRLALPNVDDSPTKTALLDLGWAERELPNEELYDLMLDPAEVDNRASDPGAQAVLSELRGRLDRWMEATDDPLLGDGIPLAAEIAINDPDGLSPSEEPTRYTEPIFREG